MDSWSDAYEVVARLGSGVSGTVYLARHRASGEHVAVRILAPDLAADPGVRAQLRGQSAVLSRLALPNSVAVRSFLEDGDRAALVTEYVPGTSTRTLLRDGPFRVQDALVVVDDVLSALAKAHERGVVHGDISPECILVDTAGVAKVADYGLSTAIGGHRPSKVPNRVYSSPEVLAGGALDAGSDLYPTAAVLCELLTGWPPLRGISPQELSAREIPEPLVTVIQRAVDPDRARRPPTADEFQAQLRGAARKSYGRKWRDRDSLGAAVSGLMVAAGGAALASGSAGGSGSAAGSGIAGAALASGAAGAAGGAGAAGAARAADAPVGRGRRQGGLRSRLRRSASAMVGRPRFALAAVVAAIALAAVVAAAVTLTTSSNGPTTATPSTQSQGAGTTSSPPPSSPPPTSPSTTIASTGPSSSISATQVPAVGTAPATAPATGSSAPAPVTKSAGQPGKTTTEEVLSEIQAQYPGTDALSSVSCATSSDCWAVGASSGGGALIFATENGGATWKGQVVPSGLSYLNGVSCPGASNCFAVGAGPAGAVMIWTTDGGAAWSSQTFPATIPDLYGISCTSVTRCFAVGSSSSPSGSSVAASAVAVATADAGGIWIKENLPGGISFLSAVSCSDASSCVAAGRSTAGGPVTVRTGNGGASWSSLALPRLDAEIAADVVTSTTAPASTTTVPASTTTAPTSTTTAPTTTTTTTTTTTPPPTATTPAPTTPAPTQTTTGPSGPVPGSPGGLAYSGSDPYTVSCPTGSDCALTSSDQGLGVYLERTTDGGGAWSAESLPSLGAGAVISAVSCPSSSECWAVGRADGGALALVTINGGGTWFKLALPAPVSGAGAGLSAISCPSTAACWAVGQETGGRSSVVVAIGDGILASSATVPGPRMLWPVPASLLLFFLVVLAVAFAGAASLGRPTLTDAAGTSRVRGR